MTPFQGTTTTISLRVMRTAVLDCFVMLLRGLSE